MQVKTRGFTSDTEVAALVEAFENFSIPASEFSHPAHIAVALAYLAQMSPEASLERMREKIRAFAKHHGADHLYHETLTAFWMRLLDHLTQIYNVDLPLWQRINLIVERWGNRQPVDAHYSPEVLQTAHARQGWVPPDRLPLPF